MQVTCSLSSFFFVSQLMHLKIIGHGLARQNFPTLKVPPHVCCKNYWVSWKVLSCSLSSILLVKYKCKLCFFPFQYLMYVSCCLIMEKICYVRSVRILWYHHGLLFLTSKCISILDILLKVWTIILFAHFYHIFLKFNDPKLIKKKLYGNYWILLVYWRDLKIIRNNLF